MFKLNLKLMAGAALCAAMLAGCGGDDDTVAQPNPPPAPAPQTISAVVEYINALIDSSEPIDINSLTLATDDTSEPATLQ
jgi:hypothetical protein